MADLDDIYNTKILELAAALPRAGRLAAPDATASAHSKLCGSTVSVDVVLKDGLIVDFSQTVKACLLGQAAASVVGREIVGTSVVELRGVAAQMRAMLKENGQPPTGRWADLAVLQPVRDYGHRHKSTLLVFDAVETAISQIEAARSGAAAQAGAKHAHR
jgi:NifU-like protein involved in Fe-S cluster formation